LNLFNMARKGALLEVRQAVQEARKRNAPVRRDGIALRYHGRLRKVDVEVIPLKGSADRERHLLVLFGARPPAAHRGGAGPRKLTRDGAPGSKENAKLRQELDEAGRFLHAITQEHEAAHEELQSANEEVLSANEELQSINEELETAKEELQSSNEELVTLNQELQDRNLQTARALEYANGIVETVRNPLLILDSDLRVERANGSFYEYFRVTPGETVGTLVSELGHGQWDIPALREAFVEILSRDARLDGFEVEHQFPRIGRRTLVVNARKLSRESLQESILLAFEDRTELRRIDREREALLEVEQRARLRAEEADRLKDEFVATLSHELRGPLGAIVGWVHVLRANGMNDPVACERGMAAIERGVKSQTRLIDDLLDYSRMVAGRLLLEPRLMDVVAATEAAIEAVGAAAGAKGIKVELAVESRPAMVHADPERLQQILWNLLSNAVKFTPSGGRVEVSIGRVGANLQVRVTDTGRGLSPDFLPHVFERFRQADGSPRRREGGLGLGLAIVKELVELQGGTVLATSPGLDQGATFQVVLPVPALLMAQKDAEPATLGEAPRPEPTSGLGPTILEGMRVLVVEDELDGREMLVSLFEGHGAKATGVASATEAMEANQRTTPDVLVCYIGLPGEDGHELMRRIRALEVPGGGRLPALALTAYAAIGDRQKALSAGFDLHLPKPASPAELVAKAALLGGARA
jgi:two-component system CheB/CheR fusion protein